MIRWRKQAEWTKLKDIVVGDAFHRWGDRLGITSITQKGNMIIAEYKDTDGKIKSIEDDNPEHEYLVHHLISNIN